MGSDCEFTARGLPTGVIIRLLSSYAALYLLQFIVGADCWQRADGDCIGE
jgi:hypothetical protein